LPFKKFFCRLLIHALIAKIWPDKVVRWCSDGDFGDFLRPAFSSSRVQHISDMHCKFALSLLGDQLNGFTYLVACHYCYIYYDFVCFFVFFGK